MDAVLPQVFKTRLSVSLQEMSQFSLSYWTSISPEKSHSPCAAQTR